MPDVLFENHWRPSCYLGDITRTKVVSTDLKPPYLAQAGRFHSGPSFQVAYKAAG